MSNDVNKLLNYMEAVLERAKTVPLSPWVVVTKEEMLDLIDRVRSVLPREIQEANGVLKRADDIVRQAKADGDNIVEEAKKEAQRRVDNNEILKDVKIQAAKITEEVNNEREIVREKTVAECLKLKKRVITDAIAIRQGADRYAEDVIKRLIGYKSQLTEIVDSGEVQLEKLRENSDEQIAYYKSIYDSNDLNMNRE